jgi:hypothetical protein
MQPEPDTEEKKDIIFSFTIPKLQDPVEKKPKLEFEIKKNTQPSQKMNFKVIREPQKSTQDYLEILKKLNILLNSRSISDAQRRDYCKSQRYFMKLYLDEVSKS